MHPPIGKFSKLSLSSSSYSHPSPRSGPGMAPVTRSHAPPDARAAHQRPASQPGGSRRQARHSLSLRDASTDGDDDSTYEEDDDDEGPVQSPLTSLFYDIDGLDDETQELVRELFRPPAPEETPPIVIEWCGISNDPDVYAFQLQEIVPRTIRIGSATSRIPKPSCNCTGAEDRPCRHLVWLMDQIAKQTISKKTDLPLVLDPTTAFPRELGNAYGRIADFHIAILANALHCRAEPPNGRPDSHRVREAREILAGLQGVQDDDGVDAYAPAIFDLGKAELEALLWGAQAKGQQKQPAGKSSPENTAITDTNDSEDEISQDDENIDYNTQAEPFYTDSDRSQDEPENEDNIKVTVEQEEHQDEQIQDHAVRQPGMPRKNQQIRDLVERGDLQQTVLRLLVSNDEFFAMFLKLLGPQDKARDPFRKIQQRIASVLGALRAARTTGEPRKSAAREVISVEWAAKHVQSAVHQVLHLLQKCGEADRKEWAASSAARAILCMLLAIVSKHTRDAHAGATQDERNLYQRLIGNNTGTGSVLLDALDAVHDQVQFLSQVERVRRRIQRNGYREAYMERLDDILARMRLIRDEEGGEGTEKARLPSPGTGTKRPDPPSGGPEQRSKRPR